MGFMRNFDDDFERRIKEEIEDQGEDLSSISDMESWELKELAGKISSRLGKSFDSVLAMLAELAGLEGDITIEPVDDDEDDDEDDEEEEEEEDDE